MRTYLKYLLWGLGDWGLGIGDWGLGPIPIPNPQSPIPIPHPQFIMKKFISNLKIIKKNNSYKEILKFMRLSKSFILKYQSKYSTVFKKTSSPADNVVKENDLPTSKQMPVNNKVEFLPEKKEDDLFIKLKLKLNNISKMIDNSKVKMYPCNPQICNFNSEKEFSNKIVKSGPQPVIKVANQFNFITNLVNPLKEKKSSPLTHFSNSRLNQHLDLSPEKGIKFAPNADQISEEENSSDTSED